MVIHYEERMAWALKSQKAFRIWLIRQRLDVCIMTPSHLDTILASQMRVADVVIFVDP